MKKLALYLVVGATLLGCGSDDSRPGVMPGLPPGGTGQPTTPNQGGSTPNQPPTDSNTPPSGPGNEQSNAQLLPGIYTGKVSDGNDVEGLVDDNKRLWFIYSEDDDILGFINSNNNVKSSNGKFSEKGKNYSYEARSSFNVTIDGDLKASKVITGSVTGLPSDVVTYNLQYDDTLSAKKQSLTMINNRIFNGDSYVTGDSAAGITRITFGTNGSFTGFGEGCSMTGSLIPSASGRYFNTSVKFTSAGCFANGETHSGVALLDNNNELIFIGTDNNRSKAVYFNGQSR